MVAAEERPAGRRCCRLAVRRGPCRPEVITIEEDSGRPDVIAAKEEAGRLEAIALRRTPRSLLLRVVTVVAVPPAAVAVV